jgi:hypothetical protein
MQFTGLASLFGIQLPSDIIGSLAKVAEPPTSFIGSRGAARAAVLSNSAAVASFGTRSCTNAAAAPTPDFPEQRA